MRTKQKTIKELLMMVLNGTARWACEKAFVTETRTWIKWRRTARWFNCRKISVTSRLMCKNYLQKSIKKLTACRVLTLSISILWHITHTPNTNHERKAHLSQLRRSVIWYGKILPYELVIIKVKLLNEL